MSGDSLEEEHSSAQKLERGWWGGAPGLTGGKGENRENSRYEGRHWEYGSWARVTDLAPAPGDWCGGRSTTIDSDKFFVMFALPFSHPGMAPEWLNQPDRPDRGRNDVKCSLLGKSIWCIGNQPHVLNRVYWCSLAVWHNIYLLQMFLGTLSTCKNVIMVQRHRGRTSGLRRNLKDTWIFNTLCKLLKVRWLSGIRPGPVWWALQVGTYLLGTLAAAKWVFQLSPLISLYIIFRKGSVSLFVDLYRGSLGFSEYII